MANRDVTITLKVKDGEVKTATASVERLKKAASDVGPISSSKGPDGAAAAAAKRLGISYDDYIKKTKLASAGSREVTRAITDTAAAAKTAAPAVGSAGASLGSLAGAGAAAGAVVAGVAVVILGVIVAAVKLGSVIFDVTQQFAKYATEIGKGAEETGLAAETVSALTHELEAQGKSFNDLKGPISGFRKLIGEAAAGSEDARKKLNLLGIEPKKAITDLNGAFITAIDAIKNTRDPVEQVRLAFAAFGTEGYKLIPTLRAFPGDFAKISQRARELNLIVGDEGVRKGKDFQRVWTEIKQQADGIGRTFGESLGDPVIRVMTSINEALVRNQGAIKSWADSAASHFERIIALVEKRPLSTLFGGALGAAIVNAYDTPVNVAPNFNAVGPDRSKIEGREPAKPADLAAIEAARAEAEKRQKELLEQNKKNAAALIDIWKLAGGQAETELAKTFKSIADEFADNQNIDQFQQQVATLQASYLASIEKTYQTLDALEKNQAKENNLTANELQLLQAQQLKRRQDAGQKATDIEQQVADLIKKANEKADKETVASAEAASQQIIEVVQATTARRIAETEQALRLGIIKESTAANEIGNIQRELLVERKTQLQDLLKIIQGDAVKRNAINAQLTALEAEMATQRIDHAAKVKAALDKESEAAAKRLQEYQNFKNSLEDELDALSSANRELSVYQETLRDIERNYKDIAPAQKEHLLGLAAQIDLVTELNKKHDDLKEFFSDSLRYVFEGDFDGLFRSLQRRLTEPFIDRISDFLATNLLGFDPNATDNPVAKPIVGKISQTNEILNRMLVRMGGSPVGGGVAGLALGALTGGGIPGIGPGGTGVFNPFAGNNLNGPTGSLATLPNGEQAVNVNGGGGFLGNLKNLFSTKPGGIFAARNNVLTGKTSRMGGIAGGIGDLASLAGGLIGGRAGGILSSVGTGLSIGSMFGPWGAAIGAGIGLIAGLFGGDPKRKADKKENIPALNKGFVDALKQLNDILAGVRSLSIEPDEAISRANEVRAEIAGGFGIQFQSKKYRKQARTMIAAKLTQADVIIEQIKAGAEIARGAADRSKRILPEFAGGHYFADFFKPNGLMPGMFDGRDNILAMISRGEMVLNPNQQNRVRALAGSDVFAGAGIPNYPKGSSSPKLAIGGMAGAGLALSASPSVVVQPNFTMYVEGVSFDERSRAWIESDGGKRTLVNLIKKEKKSDSKL